jgi:hypothetical protein
MTPISGRNDPIVNRWTKLLLKIGLVKNETQAFLVTLALIFVCVGAALFILMNVIRPLPKTALTPDQVSQLGPIANLIQRHADQGNPTR